MTTDVMTPTAKLRWVQNNDEVDVASNGGAMQTQ
jgi:hypothetical protein